jgi:hypothetical protein
MVVDDKPKVTIGFERERNDVHTSVRQRPANAGKSPGAVGQAEVELRAKQSPIYGQRPESPGSESVS